MRRMNRPCGGGLALTHDDTVDDIFLLTCLELGGLDREHNHLSEFSVALF